MKRIIEGKTYNTETATCVAKAYQHPQDDYNFNELYQTRHGAYFMHYGDLSRGADDHGFMEIRPLTPAGAQTWMEEHASTDLLEAHFGEQPEAGESESRLTVRIPDKLKERVEASAAANKQSVNAWIMRCLESCAGHSDRLR